MASETKVGSFLAALSLLRPGGMYVIDDVRRAAP
jgi:predicted O-methyltransferase YrrM